MVAAVAVEDIDGMDLVKIMLEGIGREDAGDAGIKAGAKNGGQASLAEFLAVGPLPAIIEVSGKALLLAALLINSAPGGVVGVFRLVVGGVDIVDAAGQASVHNGQILIGQRDVQYRVRFVPIDQGFEFFDVVGVHLCGGDFSGGLSGQLFLQCVALRDRAASNAQLRESPAVLATFLDGDRGDAPAADNQQFAHEIHTPFIISRD